MKILIDNRALVGANLEKLRKYQNIEMFVIDGMKATVEDVQDADVIWGWVNPELLIYANKLKWIHLPSAGSEHYNHLDLYKNRSIILTKSSGTNGVAIAEHVICFILMLNRNFKYLLQLQNNHIWGDGVECKILSGATVTILGTGDIGTTVAQYLGIFKCKIKGFKYSIEHNESPYFEKLYDRNNLMNALKGTDYLCICLPDTPETENLIGEKELQLLNRGAVVINVGRGKTLQTNALINALENGQVGGAGLDVTEPEPLYKDSPLWDMPNVIISPHTAPRSKFVFSHRVDLFCSLLDAFLEGKELWNRVNFERRY